MELGSVSIINDDDNNKIIKEIRNSRRVENEGDDGKDTKYNTNLIRVIQYFCDNK